MPLPATMMYLIDGVAISPDAIKTIEYLHFVNSKWLPVKNLAEWRQTPEHLRAIRIHNGFQSILMERPQDIFTVDLSVLMNAKPHQAGKDKLDATTGTLPAHIPQVPGGMANTAAAPPAPPIIPGMTNP